MPQAEHGGDGFGDFVTAADRPAARYHHVLTGHAAEDAGSRKHWAEIDATLVPRLPPG